MQPDQQTDQILHKKLPIDSDEKVLEIYRHHWFAYVSSWAFTIIVVICVFGLAVVLTSFDPTVQQYKAAVLVGAALFSLMVLIGGFVPAYLRSQEQLVLTDESLLKLLKPTIFSHRVDQLGLQHVADVSVHQDVIGTMFGFGTITVETEGEQRTNYDFIMVPDPTRVAQQINEQKENFDAALQSGRLETSLGAPAAPRIDPQQYQEFLQYQQMVKMQQQGGAAPQTPQNIPRGDQDSNPNQ